MRSLVAFAAAAAVAAPALAQTPIFNDVVYANVLRDDGIPMPVRLDVYWNNNVAPTAPSPCVVWIHGGGWVGGTHDNVPQMVRTLLSSGFVIASVEYRLSGEAIFPAQIHDVKGAIRHLKRNAATYRIDPARIGTWGTSAGGHLSALMLTSNNVFEAEGAVGGLGPRATVRAAVDFFGPSDILNMNLDVTNPPGSGIDHDAATSPESQLIGFDAVGQGIGVLRANQNNPAAPFPEKMRLVTLANPITHVDPRDLRIFISHGTVDTTVPIKQSQRLFDAMNAVNTSPQFIPVTGAGHGALGIAVEATARQFLIDELTRCLPDLDRDGLVDDADFVRFAFSYNTLFDARADLSGDGLCDDDDFVIFARAYESLGC